MFTYAVAADVLDANPPWLTEAPANLGDLLRAATVVIARAANLDPYTSDPSLDPVSAPVLRDATCAQVKSWISLGIDPARAGSDMPGPVKRSTMLTATVERDTSLAVKRIDELCDGVAPEAEQILAIAGLLYVPGPSTDPCASLLPAFGSARRPTLAPTLTGEWDWSVMSGWPGI